VSRLLADHLPVRVSVEEDVPKRVMAGDRRERAVTRVFSRWRVETDWWRKPVAREYWKLALEEAAGEELVVELYLDRLRGDWFLTRLYD
jgi:hypothetical protein